MYRKFLEKYVNHFPHINLFCKFVMLYDKLIFEHSLELEQLDIDTIVFIIKETEIVDYSLSDDSNYSKNEEHYKKNSIELISKCDIFVPKTIFDYLYELNNKHIVDKNTSTLIKYIYIAGDYYIYNQITIAAHIKKMLDFGNSYFLDRTLTPLDRLLVRAIKYSGKELYELPNTSNQHINYKICKRLSSGVSGVTFEVKIANQEIAVLKKYSSSNDNLGYILREISALKYLEHDNIVKFIDYRLDYDNMILLTEHGGVTLSSCLKDNLSQFSKFHLIYQLVSGLEYIHNSGYIHGDLKPDNIVVTDNHNLKIIDFGFCVTNMSSTQYLKRCTIKPVSMSAPEIYCGCSWSIYYDIWSIGILIFYIVASKNKKIGFASLQDLIDFTGYPTIELPYDIYSIDLIKTTDCVLDHIKPKIVKNLLKGIFNFHPEKRLSLAYIKNIINSLKIINTPI